MYSASSAFFNRISYIKNRNIGYQLFFCNFVEKLDFMTVLEQNTIKEKYYKEAIRYINNAKETLKKAKKEGRYYQDEKYTKSACGIAYLAVLKALDCILELRNIPKPKGKVKRIDIDFYKKNITNIDNKLLDALNNAYKLLHLSGYYDGITSVKVINEGFEEAMEIIDKIKPSPKN